MSIASPFGDKILSGEGPIWRVNDTRAGESSSAVILQNRTGRRIAVAGAAISCDGTFNSQAFGLYFHNGSSTEEYIWGREGAGIINVGINVEFRPQYPVVARDDDWKLRWAFASGAGIEISIVVYGFWLPKLEG